MLPQPLVRVRWLLLTVGMPRQGFARAACVSPLRLPLAELSGGCGVSQGLLISHVTLISGYCAEHSGLGTETVLGAARSSPQPEE